MDTEIMSLADEAEDDSEAALYDSMCLRLEAVGRLSEITRKMHKKRLTGKDFEDVNRLALEVWYIVDKLEDSAVRLDALNSRFIHKCRVTFADIYRKQNRKERKTVK